jgi:predicted metalloprotease with PDZ domain
MTGYRLRIADLNQHQFEIACEVKEPAPEQRFRMPSWIPGSYLLREYARHVVSLRAESGGRALPISKLDHASWCVTGARALLRLTIRVHALDLSVRGSYLDGTRAYFNGPCVFLSVDGKEHEPVALWIEKPIDSRCDHWRVATAMSPAEVDAMGYGRYSAQSYDELIDYPVEISDFDRVEFSAGRIPHALVIAGRHDSDLERVATDLTQLCETQLGFFGEPAPFDRYLFLGLAVDRGYGGLEHRASSSLLLSADDLPRPGETGVPADYQRFLSLCSHEYFHAWHIKQLKPAAFVPYRLDRRNHTRLLWVFEGITSYYQDLMLLRSGLIGREAYLTRLAQMLSKVYRAPGRHQQSLAEASFDAWDKLYKPEPNSINATISYYSKGALVALALDLTLRERTGSACSLDRVLRALWETVEDRGGGLAELEFEAVVTEISGTELGDFFDLAIRGTADLPLSSLLDAFGIRMELRAALGPHDLGGVAASVPDRPPLTLGASFRDGREGLELVSVLADGSAEAAGLIAGDVIVALGGRKVDPGSLARRLSRYEPAEAVTVAFFRRNELLQRELVLKPAPADTCSLVAEPDPDAACRALRQAWLGS